MSDPRKVNPDASIDDLLHAALLESISARSSLHMYPDPIPGGFDGQGFLSETDGNAAHSVEHMLSVFDHVSEAKRKLPRLSLADLKTLQSYQELRAYMQNEWREDLAEEALDLADKLAAIVERIRP